MSALPPASRPVTDSSVPKDPLVRVTLAGTTVGNPAELWQEAARILLEVVGGGFIRIDYSGAAWSGSTDIGVAPEMGTTVTWEREDQHVDVTVGLPDDLVDQPSIVRFAECAAAVSQLVARRARLEHERRRGSFLVEVSRWMLTSSADAAVMRQHVLTTTLQQIGATGAMILAVGADGAVQPIHTAGAAGSIADDLVEALQGTVLHAVETDEAVLVDDIVTAAGTYVPDTVTAKCRRVLVVPLRAAHETTGVLCLLRGSTQEPGHPFSTDDIDEVASLTSHLAGNLEFTDAVTNAQQAAVQVGSMVDQTPFPLALVSRYGVIDRVNTALLALVGIEDCGALTGRSVEVLPVTIGGGSWDDALASWESGVPWRGRVDVQRDGDVRLCDGLVNRLGDDAKGDLLLALHDRTDELRARRQMRSREKLAAVGELAAGVAHEVNNPLTTIRAEAQLLSHQAGPEVAEAVETIIKEVDRAARIAKGLLRVSRHSETRSLVRVNELVAEVVAIRSRVVRGVGIELTADLAASDPAVIGNPGDLQQVFVNLITNAEQALAERPAATIRVTTAILEDQVRVTVADSGPGVPPELRESVFKPFFTTKGADDGTGLGLSLSHNTVTEHGGTMWIEDGPLGGAAFVIELPVVPD